MTLTFQISDEMLTRLKNALKISVVEHDEMFRSASLTPAVRIIEARRALDLSVEKFECCHDYDPSKDEPIKCW